MKNYTQEKIISEFRKWFGHGKPGHLHALLAEDYFKEQVTWLRKTLTHIEEEAKKEEREKKITENTSDGYHTFKELYEFRKVYNAVLFNEWAKQGKFNVHKSKRHHDGELCFGGGWFIVLATLPTGQISNHYELKDWDLFQCQEREKADEWDGHTPQDVVKRLLSLSQQTPQEKEEPDYNKAMYDLEHKEECACDTRINQFCKIHGYHRDRKGSS